MLLRDLELGGGALELGRIAGASGRLHDHLGGDQGLPAAIDVLVHCGTGRGGVAADGKQGEDDDRGEKTKPAHRSATVSHKKAGAPGARSVLPKNR